MAFVESQWSARVDAGFAHSWTSQQRAAEAKMDRHCGRSQSEVRLFSPFNSQSPNWAPIVEIRPLSSVPCIYSTCNKEAFISLEQIINTFH